MSAVFDNIGADFYKFRRADSRIVRELVAALTPLARGPVVDVGAGTGNYSRALAEMGWQVIGLEPSRVMMRLAPAHGGVEWVAGVAERMPLATACAGGVVSVLALHHLTDLDSAIREMVRISPAGPLVLFTFDRRLSVSGRLKPAT